MIYRVDIMKPIIKRIINDMWFDISHPSYENFNYYSNFLYNLVRARITNSPDYSSEIFFWQQAYYRYYVSGKYPSWWDMSLTKNRYSKEMIDILGILSKDFDEKLKLVDVGSGPVTSYFDKIDITAWEIVAVDPLAKLYNRLNKKYNAEYTIQCTKGTGEQIDEIFDRNSFHLVLSQNAIDHSLIPQKFINNLVYICKPGGFIYLSGFIKEGTAANWLGLHKHDLYIIDNNLFWTNWNNTANNINITENLGIALFYKEVNGNKPGDKFKLIYRKNLD